MRVVFASGNPGKLKEVRDILKDTGLQIISMREAGITAEIKEDGETFEENAVLKAKVVLDLLPETEDTLVLADDSGLEIDFLDGEPGVFSSRYLGEDTPYSEKNANLINRLYGVPLEERTARFRCVIAAVLPDGRVLTTEGSIEGKIGYEEKGSNGFGYDPIFYLPDMSVTTAELSEEEKNRISHRGLALRKMEQLLREEVQYDK